MRKRKSDDVFQLEQVLLWYEGPQIAVLSKSAREKVIAVAVNFDGYDNPFFGAYVTPKQLSEYQDGKFDLRYLMAHPDLRRWYVFDFPVEEAPTEARRVTRSHPFWLHMLPDSGIFSRAHDSIKLATSQAPTSIEKFDIDGSWDLSEFSKFYVQVEDIYYMYNALSRYTSGSVSQESKEYLQDAFMRPFRGGGSYLGFYDSIANDNDPTARIRVSGIKYNSPGYVEIKANEAAFSNMIELLGEYGRNSVSIKKAYLILYKYLQSLGLLKATKDAIAAESVTEGIEGYARALATQLHGINFDTVLSMARGDILAAAKVVLSIQRRVAKLYNFFEQGRVKHDRLSEDVVTDDA